VQIPKFSESQHPLIKPLSRYSDRELLTLFERYPEQGKYFVAIFCRYSSWVYALIAQSARSPVQADYVFALTWRHIYDEMRGLALPQEGENDGNNFQDWLIKMTALCINKIVVPPVESISYNLQAAPPPFWCYLGQALDLLPPLNRLITIMAQTFHWSETRISAYLKAEGDTLSPTQIQAELQKSYTLLTGELPEDIREIYLHKDGIAANQVLEPLSV
jgi:hypothetical protein